MGLVAFTVSIPFFLLPIFVFSVESKLHIDKIINIQPYFLFFEVL